MSKDNMTLSELAKKYPDKTYKELTAIQGDTGLIREAKEAEDKIVKEDRGPLDLTRKVEELQARVKELDNSLSIALEINDSHQRYNAKLQVRLTEVEEDNKKLTLEIENLKMNGVRKAGF